MIKKLIIIGATFTVLFSMAACKSQNKDEWILLESSECHLKIESSDEYGDNIVKSATAYEEAIANFTINDGKFLDDFGGVFVDANGIYNICTVGESSFIQSDYIIYKRVENSYNFLESINKEIQKFSQELTIWMAGTCQMCNKVLICLENKDKIALIINHLKVMNLYRKDSLNFFVGKSEIIPN